MYLVIRVVIIQNGRLDGNNSRCYNSDCSEGSTVVEHLVGYYFMVSM